MTDRITITLPDGLVEELDRLAAASNTSRSAVIREASEAYVAAADSRTRAAELRAATEDFLAFLDEVRSRPALDNRPVVEVLRELRGPLGNPPTPDTGSR